MHVSRRGFLAAAAAGAGVAASRWGAGARAGQPPAGSAAAGSFFTWIKISDRLRVATGEGGNALLVKAGPESLLIDCKNAPYGGVLRTEAEAFGVGVRHVINTHHHADHTGGNHAFTADVEVMAHDNAGARIRGQVERYLGQIADAPKALEQSQAQVAAPVREAVAELAARARELTAESFVPRRLIGADGGVIIGAGDLLESQQVLVRHFGAGHTDNDLVVYVPGLKVLHTGDLVFRRLYPFFDRAGGATVEGWIESLHKAAALCAKDTVVVPGHGELTDVTGIREQREFLERARDTVADAVKASRTRGEVEAMAVPGYGEYGRVEFRARLMGGIYDELTGAPVQAPAAPAAPAAGAGSAGGAR